MRSTALFLAIAVACACTVQAQNNTVAFDNQSGEAALVKLIGPTTTDVPVPTGGKVTVPAQAGRYEIKVRYGGPDKYRYTKGEPFDVTGTPGTRSVTTITLHKVIAGNYHATDISAADFGASQKGTAPANSPVVKGLGKLRVVIKDKPEKEYIVAAGVAYEETGRYLTLKLTTFMAELAKDDKHELPAPPTNHYSLIIMLQENAAAPFRKTTYYPGVWDNRFIHPVGSWKINTKDGQEDFTGTYLLMPGYESPIFFGLGQGAGTVTITEIGDRVAASFHLGKVTEGNIEVHGDVSLPRHILDAEPK